MRKIPTLYRRDPQDMRRLLPGALHPDCAWVLAGEGVATRKYDGTCFLFLGGDGGWWARREVKPGKTAPPRFITVEHDELTGKTVGWEPAEQSAFAKIHAEAVDLRCYLDEWPHASPRPGRTYELVGPKINGNPEGLDEHILVRHGYLAAQDEDELKSLMPTFEDLRVWLRDHPDWEGVVWHHPDGRMAKIKRRDFS